MAFNKVVASNGEVLMDLTADTVTAETLLAGSTAHDRSGNAITGTYTPPEDTGSGGSDDLSQILSGSVVVKDEYETEANEYGTTVIL